ncbi:MAG: DsbA family protein [Patescibacteria group bacterium]
MFQKNTANKKYFVLAVSAIVIITAIILGINNSADKNKKTGDKELSKISGVQAQSYAASSTPKLNSEDHVYGTTDGKLKIFVYEDYANLYSAKLADTLEKIKQENNNISIIVRPFFQNISSNLISKEAALAMACSKDKWLEMRALLFAQVKNDQFNINNFSANAKQLGLDENEFNTCLTNPEKSRTIEKSLEEAKAYSVVGVPTIFVGDEMIPGARPYEDYVDSNGDNIEGLKKVIDRKMAQ